MLRIVSVSVICLILAVDHLIFYLWQPRGGCVVSRFTFLKPLSINEGSRLSSIFLTGSRETKRIRLLYIMWVIGFVDD